jgi:putative ABC transport system permease protein
MINEQLARREGLAPGDAIRSPAGPATVAGVYSDYGNPLAQVLVSPARLTDLPGGRAPPLRPPPAPRRRPGPRHRAGGDFGLDPDNIIDQSALKAFSLQVFERTFAVTGALNVMTLAVAGFAILTSLLTLARCACRNSPPSGRSASPGRLAGSSSSAPSSSRR